MLFLQVLDDGDRGAAMTFEEASYARHASHFEAEVTDEQRRRIVESWLDETTIDHWRHARAYECVDCIASDPSASWLTIGDGRWGLDSVRIRSKGFANVLPTDISEPLLQAAAERGLIEHYRVENAERLTFDNRQFDYVFCKESLHHFPRPYIALYEMFRVARRAVFIIEPNDPRAQRLTRIPITRKLLRDLPGAIADRLRGRPGYVHAGEVLGPGPGGLLMTPEWEQSGNFLYSFSRLEAEKIALGLNLPQLAIKGLNDHYVPGCEFEPADPAKSAIAREIMSTVERMDADCRAGIRDCSLLMVAFFLEPGASTTIAELARRGWKIIDIPANPYLAR
jgi:SAM-dependent methyltransferase